MTPRKPDGRIGEFELIAKLLAPLARDAPGAFELADDVAIFTVPANYELVLKTDAIVESVDFFRSDPADSIAQKALRVNLSDLAAKGASPAGYLMTLLLPDWVGAPWLENFVAGLERDQKEFGLALMGGDISATPGPLSISITALGFVPQGALIRRAGAKPGDCVLVSGAIGDSAGGLSLLKGEVSATTPEALITRYRLPSPRLALGLELHGLATASLDVSDGLVADLEHLAKASRVRIAVDAMRIPLSADLLSLWGDSLATRVRAATSGDDYEIAFTVAPDTREAAFTAARRVGVPISEIGRVEAGEGVRLLDAQMSEINLSRKGFSHF